MLYVHIIFGSGCPVAIQVKLCACPAIITDVTGGVTIFGTSTWQQKQRQMCIKVVPVKVILMNFRK